MFINLLSRLKLREALQFACGTRPIRSREDLDQVTVPQSDLSVTIVVSIYGRADDNTSKYHLR